LDHRQNESVSNPVIEHANFLGVRRANGLHVAPPDSRAEIFPDRRPLKRHLS
jgi:hypothetical protein